MIYALYYLQFHPWTKLINGSPDRVEGVNPKLQNDRPIKLESVILNKDQKLRDIRIGALITRYIIR